MSRLEKFVNEAEIKDLLVRERYYRDSHKWENLRQCYHPDAAKTSINITWYNGDVDGFVTGSEQMAARKSASSSHTVCPVVVTVNGNRAVSESIGTILVRFTYDGGSYDCCSHGLFVSRLERSDDEWKMLSLEVIYDRDSIQSVTPSSNNIGIEVDPKARESYRCLAWVLAQNGFSVDQTLPGTDDPGSAEDLMSRSFKWLKAQ